MRSLVAIHSSSLARVPVFAAVVGYVVVAAEVLAKGFHAVETPDRVGPGPLAGDREAATPVSSEQTSLGRWELCIYSVRREVNQVF